MFIIDDNERPITHRLDAHNEECWVFVNARYSIKGLSIGINPTGDRPRVGEEDPDGVEGDGKEMSEQREEGWRYAEDVS